MLKIDPASKTLVSVSPTTLTQANVLERADLQKAIISSWGPFCSELGYEELYFVGSEIIPHDSCDNRIDILALKRNGTPVIFELKRHRERLQLLQALSYSAMVARWDAARFLKEIGGKAGDLNLDRQRNVRDVLIYVGNDVGKCCVRRDLERRIPGRRRLTPQNGGVLIDIAARNLGRLDLVNRNGA